MPQTSGRSIDVGRIEPAAEPDLDDAGIGGRAREGEEGGGGRHLEEARADARRRRRAPRPAASASCASSISRPARRMRSLKRTRCGLVKTCAESPAASIAARRKAQVDPLPLVPATWNTGGSARSGWPSRSSSAAIRSSPSVSAPGESRRQPVELRLNRRIVGAGVIGHSRGLNSASDRPARRRCADWSW